MNSSISSFAEDVDGDGKEDEGCTISFWKKNTENWPEQYNPANQFDSVFGFEIPGKPDLTLVEALNSKEGDLGKMLSQGAGAALNAAFQDGDLAYPHSMSTVIRNVEDGLDPKFIHSSKYANDNDFKTRFNALKDANDSHCPLFSSARESDWQFREHKSTVYSPDFIFTKEPSGDKRLQIFSQGSESIGLANVFKVFKKSDIQNHDIKVTWERSTFGPGTSQANIILYDGSYDRTSTSDFPDGSIEAVKGDGMLGGIIGSPASGWAEKTDVLESSTIEYSASQNKFVTLLIDSGDSQFSTNYSLKIRSIEIEGYGKWTFENPKITSEQSGTLADYGIITGHNQKVSENDSADSMLLFKDDFERGIQDWSVSDSSSVYPVGNNYL